MRWEVGGGTFWQNSVEVRAQWTGRGWFWFSSIGAQKEGKGWQLCCQKGHSNNEPPTSLLKLYATNAMKTNQSLTHIQPEHTKNLVSTNLSKAPTESRWTQVSFVQPQLARICSRLNKSKTAFSNVLVSVIWCPVLQTVRGRTLESKNSTQEFL